MPSPDRILKLLILLLCSLSVLLIADLMPMDDDVLRNAEQHEAMARDCVKPDGILVGLKSLFFCQTPAAEEK